MEHLLFKDWIRHQRVLRDLTQEALAEEVGCAVQTIRAFEHGWRRPSRALAERLATILTVPQEQREAFLQAARVPVPRQPEPALPTGPADPAGYLTQLANKAPGMLYSSDQQRYLLQLDTELDVIRAALAWAFAAPDVARMELGLQAASALDRFWYGRGHQLEGLRWLEQGIALAEHEEVQVATGVLAAAICTAGWLARLCGDRTRAMILLRRCIPLYQAIGDTLGTSDALDTLGDLAIFEGDAIAASWFFEECLALRRQLGRPVPIALAINGLGQAAIVRGYYERAAEYFLESLSIIRPFNDRRSTALALHGLGLARLRQGSLSEAAQHLHEALTLFHALDNTLDVALCLELIGELLALRVLTGDADDQDIDTGVVLWGAAEQRLQEINVEFGPHELVRRDGLIAATRARIGQEHFQNQWQAGAHLAPGDAVALGLSVV